MNDSVTQDIAGGGIIPPSAPYAHHAWKYPEVAALYAALQWIDQLLQWYPDHASNAGSTPALPIPTDNKSIIDDIFQPINDLSQTFQLLTLDFDIIHAIWTMIPSLPIMLNIFHVKAHQDCNKPFDDLSPFAQINILADYYAEQLHQRPTLTIGIFPTWLPGTTISLFHGSSLITSDIPEYIHKAAHEPLMHEYLIERSKTATGGDTQWNTDIFNNIVWQHLGKALWCMSLGQWIQLSKYMNDIWPTTKCLQTFDNKHDGQCFVSTIVGRHQPHPMLS